MARLEGLSLHVIGNVGAGGSGTCGVEAVDVAIHSDSNGAPGSQQLYSAKLLLPGDTPGSATFTWTSNTSAVLSFDLVDPTPGAEVPAAVELPFAANYWLRVKLLVPFGGSSGTARCFALWALNNATKTGSSCLWQESVGGSAGYSTTCTGAATRSLPSASQTFSSCFNGGAPSSNSTRRCLAFRNQASTAISCPAQFADFRFAFHGHNAANCSAAPVSTVANGAWPGSCAGTTVGQLGTATCTYGGGTVTTECLVTGAWSNNVTGQCAAAPTNCTAVPTATLADGTWPADCAGKLIGQTCSATCTYGGSASVTCQASGSWDSVATGSCAAAPTNCTAVPTATLTDGTWPANCAGKLIGETCTATCTYGGSASVTCQASGSWDSVSTGNCAAAPTSCSGTPSTSPSYGTWPGSCSGTLIGSTCSATCTFGGAVTAACQAGGTWSTTFTGSCTAGGTAFISESGLLPLGSDRLRVCNITGGTFSGCVSNAGFSVLAASYASSNTVWAADEGANTVSVCTTTLQTNTLSGCAASSLTGFGGTRDPVSVVVKSGVAFVANRDSSCGIIRCTDAATMTGCSCALTSAQSATNVRGIALSPAGDKLFFTSQTSISNYGIVVCALSGTTIGSCSVFQSDTTLTGIFVDSSKVYVMARFVNELLQTYSRAWVCDASSPDPSTNCVKTGTLFGSGVAGAEPGSISVFDGTAFVPDGSVVRRCTNTNDVSSCSSASGLSLSPLLSGASSIFILPRV